MKDFFKKIVLFFLKKFAKKRMRRFKGKVICVTGSVGKTSTKEAIYTVLNAKFRVIKNKGSMNTEFGLPLTILHLDSGGSSAMKWLFLLVRAFLKSFKKMYSEILVVEMGVDSPGDMDVLLSIVKPDIAVMGPIAPAHLDEGQFKDTDAIFEEKAKLVHALSEDGIAVLTADDDRVVKLKKGRSKSKTFTYGTEVEADYKATGIEEDIEGIRFNLSTDGRRMEVIVPVLGQHHVSVILPAIICGLVMRIEVEEVIESLKRFRLPPGRLNLIEGAPEGSVIIDGSYNSSPKSCVEALRTLSGLKPKSGGRKIAILGNMNELGENSDRLHRQVGKNIPDSCDVLVTVGKAAEGFADVAEEGGMKKVFRFKNVAEVVEGFKDKVQENDLVLVKGSQNNVRLERFVKEVMKFPEQSKDLLVRQGKNWQKI